MKWLADLRLRKDCIGHGVEIARMLRGVHGDRIVLALLGNDAWTMKGVCGAGAWAYDFVRHR